jgi:hypothetical protein
MADVRVFGADVDLQLLIIVACSFSKDDEAD